MKIILTYVILLFTCVQLYGQALVQGLVISGDHMIPLENVNIQNLNYRTIATSNKDGHFFIHASRNDTILLSAIGYKDVKTTINMAESFIVIMNPTIYELSEVIINPFGTYDQFKRKVLALKIPPPVDYMGMLGFPKPVVSPVPVEYDYKKVYHPMAAIFHPVSYFYKRFNKEEKAKINYYRYITEELPVQTVIESKFNGGKVSMITGLEGDSLTQFIAFCNFTPHYLYVTSEYEIGVAIQDKLREYRMQEKKDIREQEKINQPDQ